MNVPGSPAGLGRTRVIRHMIQMQRIKPDDDAEQYRSEQTRRRRRRIRTF